MALEKNDIVRLTISDIGTDGEGIGKVDGYTLFVKDAVIGDTITARVIKLKKNYGYGRLMEVIEPSKGSVAAVRYSRCHMMHSWISRESWLKVILEESVDFQILMSFQL